MELEKTDKALASILDAVHQLSTQVSPEVFNSFSNVAMYAAQGDLISAHIWLGIGIFLGILGLFMCVGCAVGLGDECNGVGGAGAFLIVIGFIAIGVNLSTMYSPLAQAAAHDGNVALARAALDKISH